MKKIKEILQGKGKYVCVILMLVGLIVIGAGFAMANFDIYAMQTGKHERLKAVSKTMDAERLNEIEIDSYQSDVSIEPSKDDKIHITYQESKEVAVLYETNGVNLKIKRKSNSFLNGFTFQWFDFTKDENLKIHIALPKQYVGNLEIDNSYNDVVISNVQGLKRVAIKNNTGDITLDKVSMQELEIKNRYGDTTVNETTSTSEIALDINEGKINLEQVQANEFNLDIEYGNIIANQLNINGDVFLDAQQSEMKFETLQAKNLQVESRYGDFTADKLQVANKIKFDMAESSTAIHQSLSDSLTMECTYGDIQIDALEASTIQIENEEGDVSAMIMDQMQNYSINSSVENGENSLPQKFNEGAKKHLDISTNYGDVNVKFKQTKSVQN